jgi:hypothetical protein
MAQIVTLEAIRRPVPRLRHLPPEHRQLVTQHRNLHRIRVRYRTAP